MGCPPGGNCTVPGTIGSDTYSRASRSASDPPSSRRPWRSLAAASVHSRSNRPSPGSVASSPGSTRIGIGAAGSSACGSIHHGAMRTRSTASANGSTRRRSPTRSARPSTPPKPPRRSVLALPSTSATRMPPATASQARAPSRQPPMRSTLPAGMSTRRQPGNASPSMPASNAAPHSAIRVGCAKRRVGPARAISSVAADAALPTSRLAMACVSGSSAPPRPTPRWRKPSRPPACTVVSNPGASTSMPLTARLRPGRNAGDRRASAATALRAPDRTAPRRCGR